MRKMFQSTHKKARKGKQKTERARQIAQNEREKNPITLSVTVINIHELNTPIRRVDFKKICSLCMKGTCKIEA